jgi:hypothetical protein
MDRSVTTIQTIWKQWWLLRVLCWFLAESNTRKRDSDVDMSFPHPPSGKTSPALQLLCDVPACDRGFTFPHECPMEVSNLDRVVIWISTESSDHSPQFKSKMIEPRNTLSDRDPQSSRSPEKMSFFNDGESEKCNSHLFSRPICLFLKRRFRKPDPGWRGPALCFLPRRVSEEMPHPKWRSSSALVHLWWNQSTPRSPESAMGRVWETCDVPQNLHCPSGLKFTDLHCDSGPIRAFVEVKNAICKLRMQFGSWECSLEVENAICKLRMQFVS